MANQTLAIKVPPATLDMDAVDGSAVLVMQRAQTHGQANQNQYIASLSGGRFPHLVAEGVFTNDTTAVPLELIDLTDKGLKMPAGTQRKIRWRHTMQTDNDRFTVEYEQWVLGGTTPVLLGSRKVLNAQGVIAGTTVQYGDIAAQATYSGDTATAVAANSTAGSSLGNNSTNTVTLTHPVARTSPKNFWSQPARAAAAVAGARTVDVIAATSTTASVFISDVATPTAAAPSGTLNVYGFILPPGDCALVMNSNNIELQITGIDSDETRNRVEVYIEPAVSQQFQGS